MHRSYRIALSLAVTMLLAGAIPASAVTTRGISAESATGCLQKGDKPDTFKLVGKDGKTWDVWSKKVSLAGHVGHTVTLTGDVTKSDMSGMSGMKDTSMSKMGDSSKMSGMSSSSGNMNVASMTMVSATCS
ncbi:MAG TPA: hypothetical protein VK511_08120 [Gemmatimonadaceae bacterium]|nr:hypothetical protein [Gemmatimonadaceae bacterium]